MKLMDLFRHLLGQPPDRDETEARLVLREQQQGEQSRYIEAIRDEVERRRRLDADYLRVQAELDMRRSGSGGAEDDAKRN